MNKAQDLSVEEILNSIRGVINNQSSKLNKKPEVKEDILELTEERIILSEEVEGRVFDRSLSEARDALRGFADAATRFSPSQHHHKAGKTIEELTTEILKPEISKWLVNNLPGLVKQLVEKEIKLLTNRE
jgi:cell pole-organizing protein PopZ